MNTYTEQQIIEALAVLMTNGGNAKRTAKQLGIPRPTLIRWRDGAAAAEEAAVTDATALAVDIRADTSETLDTASAPVNPWARQPRDYGELWGGVQELAVARMRELLPVTTDLRAVAYAAGIAADRHLDFTLGRRGGGQVGVHTRSGDQDIALIIDL